VLTLVQRTTLVELLEQQAQRYYATAEEIDREIDAEYAKYETEEDMPDLDRKTRQYNDLLTAEDEAEELAQIFRNAQIVTTRPPAVADPADVITQALVSAWASGCDVGELLVQAVAAAQRTVYTSTDESLTSARPGSWESALVDQMISSSGWDR